MPFNLFQEEAYNSRDASRACCDVFAAQQQILVKTGIQKQMIIVLNKRCAPTLAYFRCRHKAL